MKAVTIPNKPDLDCGDNSCYFAKNKSGQRTNGGCKCFNDPANAGKIRTYTLHLEYTLMQIAEEYERLYEELKERTCSK